MKLRQHDSLQRVASDGHSSHDHSASLHCTTVEDDCLSQTTREFSLTNQRMAEKADAMAAWHDALVIAYVKADGKPPRASEN